MKKERSKQINRMLKRIVKEDAQRSINELRVIVALERAIARLERHKELAEHLIFKGGLVMLKNYESERFTRDADALAVSIDKKKLENLIRDALVSDLDDGLWYGDLHVKELDEQGNYGSYRFDCAFQIGSPDMKKIHKLSRIHIDVGFSDKLPSTPLPQTMPSILADSEPISWRVYPGEYIFAEKLETMYDRASANSRAKDIYDLVYLIPSCAGQQQLVEAIRQTFEHRHTSLPESLVNEAKILDTTFLKAAWPGVTMVGRKAEFDEIWEKLLSFLEKLDKVL